MGAKNDIEKFAKLSPTMADLISKLSKDTELVSLLKEAKGKFDAVFILKALPYFVKYEEVYKMMAIYYGKTIEEIENEPTSDFIEQFKKMMEDDTFKSFFPPVKN